MSSRKHPRYPSRQFYRRIKKDAEQELFQLLIDNDSKETENVVGDDGIVVGGGDDHVVSGDNLIPVICSPINEPTPGTSNESIRPIETQEKSPELLQVINDDSSIEDGSPLEDTYPEKTPNSDPENKNNPWSLTSFKTDIAEWAIYENIPHSKLSSLLRIVKKHKDFKDLPNDARALLKTPRQTAVQDLCGGNFIYLGVEAGIKKSLKNVHPLPKNIDLLIGVDGLPIAKSSNSQLWPQLGKIRSIPHSPVFEIGIFHGSQKPSNSNEFLGNLVEELINCIENGIKIKDEKINISHVGFVCDAPAKSFILQTKGHTGYFSCTRCKDEGKHINSRISFSSECGPKRTHTDFVTQSQEDHHVGESILIRIPRFNVVQDLPLDYMHLVCLGVVKKLVNLWLKGSLQYRLSATQTNQISMLLTSYRKFIPSDFARKPRGLDEFSRWKATELRFFLLYSGPVVLAKKKHFPKDIVENFLCLSAAMTLLLNPTLCHDYQEYAKSLLECFVSNFKKLYGSHLISHNIHGLLHISDDVSTFGPLDNCSAFCFENHMQTLKSLMRKHHLPLQQIYKRLQEQSSCDMATTKLLPTQDQFKSQHESGPLTPVCRNPQFKTLTTSKFKISCNNKDSYCLMSDNTIVKAKNFAFSPQENKVVMIGEKYDHVKDLYKHPFNSSRLNISLIKKRPNHLTVRSIDEIERKMLVLPFSGDLFAGFPLIHTD